MTELYEKLHKAIKDLWTDTPWMIDHWTDHIDSIRYEEIHDWLCDRYGRGRCFVERNAGSWRMGCATIKGHTWIGFATEEMMKEFQEEWK